MSAPKLLIVEDDEGLCAQYRWAFPVLQVALCGTRPQAVQLAKRERPPVAIVDLGLPPDPNGVSEGFATLGELHRTVPGIKVIVTTGRGERVHALRAVALGAYDFCEKPADIAVLRGIVDRGLRLYELEEENRRLADLPSTTSVRRIVTADEAMLKLCRSIEKLAPANVPVLLLGESGTGKEALALALHELGPRAGRPFVAINCGAIPENLLESELFGYERGAFTGAMKRTIGKIESAHRGTLFLDEIGDLPHPLQAKLLRFLQEQVVDRLGGREQIPVDVRIVSATNQPLDELVTAGQFRSDLLYRLNSVTVRVPPLRNRIGDPVLLARFFLARFSREFGRNIRGFSEEAVAAIAGHSWPGNVRELENRMKRAVVMSEMSLIEPADLELAAPAGALVDLDLRAARMRAEREVVQMALARSDGTMAAAAKLLGISRPTLYSLIETHGLDSAPDKVRAIQSR